MHPRALDHVVIPCPDLDEAARAYEALGFIVGRRNRHPWGTENHIIQMPGAFLELIAPAPGAHPAPPEDDAFPFAGYLAGRGTSADPSGMIVLRAADAAADAKAFADAGIGAGRMLHFSREGAAPDGTTRTVAFSLAFAEPAAMPDVGAFVCQQHYPENFWNPAVQAHPNGVTGVAAIVLRADRPAALAEFWTAFAGAAVQTGPASLRIDLAEGTAVLIEQASTSPRLVGLRLRTTGEPRRAVVGALTLAFGD